MKAYTDLEQSKKLSEMLPIDSADAFYDMAEPEKRQVPIIGDTDDYYDMEDWTIPCWSLAALLEVLPTIDNGNRNPVICKDIRLNKWHVVYHGTAVEPTIDSGVYDNLIDACVEMIFTLKERNLLK